jgi:hypothetical protein
MPLGLGTYTRLAVRIFALHVSLQAEVHTGTGALSMMFSGGSLVEKLGSNSEKALESLRSIPPVDKCSQFCIRRIWLASMLGITSDLEALEPSERDC